MVSSRRGPFNDKFAEQLCGNGFLPFREEFSVIVEVDDFKVARHLSANDADGVMIVCKPCFDRMFGGNVFLVLLPFEYGTLFFFPCWQDGESGRKVIQCCFLVYHYLYFLLLIVID